MFEFINQLSIHECNNNPNKLFLFGDNLIKKGSKGQATIRNCSNAYGIPTKRLPNTTIDSYFSDSPSEYEIVLYHLSYIIHKHKMGCIIVVPIHKLGSGLAKLQENSPKISELIDKFYRYVEQQISKIN